MKTCEENSVILASKSLFQMLDVFGGFQFSFGFSVKRKAINISRISLKAAEYSFTLIIIQINFGFL